MKRMGKRYLNVVPKISERYDFSFDKNLINFAPLEDPKFSNYKAYFCPYYLLKFSFYSFKAKNKFMSLQISLFKSVLLFIMLALPYGNISKLFGLEDALIYLLYPLCFVIFLIAILQRQKQNFQLMESLLLFLFH